MDDRWTQIRQLFRAALDVDTSERAAFLQKHCPDDAEVRARVAAMLQAYDEDDTFLEKPLVQLGRRAIQRRGRDDLVGSLVGPYLIRRAIARGGMGVVFEAFDTKLEKIVALKMMNPALMQDVAFKKRFEQEAKTLARLEDPHIVRVYALIEENGNTFIVMEYVHGITLAEHIRSRGKLTGKEVAGIGGQLLTALSKAHKQDIIHRDLKPGNIMLTRTDDGRSLVKVLDFGIAKNIQAGDNQTRTQGTVGTLYYMSPEQVRALPTIDHRTDIYSLGVTLYEALCGLLPFDVTRDEYTIRKQIVEGLLDIHPVFDSKVAGAVGGVLAKALQKNPEDRYQTADAMKIALRDAIKESLDSRSVARLSKRSPDKPSAFGNPQKPATRKTRIPLLILPLAILLLAGISVVFWFNPFEASPPPVETGAVNAIPDTPPDNSQDIPLAVADSGDVPLSSVLDSTTDTSPASALEVSPDSASAHGTEDRETAELSVMPAIRDSTAPIVEREALSESLSVVIPSLPDSTVQDEASSDTTERPDSLEDAPPPIGSITFMISPPGDVYVNDRLHTREEVIADVALPLDTYRFRVENDQGSWECDMEVARHRDRDIEISFEDRVSITVVAKDADSNVSIQNADISVDGKATGYSTPMKLELPPGLHRFEATAEGYSQIDVVAEGAKGCYQKVNAFVNLDAAGLTYAAGVDPLPRVVVRLRSVN